MMTTDARLLAVAALSVLLVLGLAGPAAGSLPQLHGLEAGSGDLGPTIHIRASGTLDTVHYSPQPGVWIVEMPEAAWDQDAALLSEPGLGIERAELSRVEEFGKTITRLTVWLSEPAQLELQEVSDGLELRFEPLERVIKIEVPDVHPEEIPAEELDADTSRVAAAEGAAADRPDLSSLDADGLGGDEVATVRNLAAPTPVSNPDQRPAATEQTGLLEAPTEIVPETIASETVASETVASETVASETVASETTEVVVAADDASPDTASAPPAAEPVDAEPVQVAEVQSPAEVQSHAADMPLGAKLVPGDNLLDLIPVRSEQGVVVELRGDGAFEGVVFTLDDPPRIVADLNGVVNRVPSHLYAVNTPLVRRVRVAQFRAIPEPVTRIVVDLEADAGYRITPTASGAVLAVGTSDLDQLETVDRMAKNTTPAAPVSSGSHETGSAGTADIGLTEAPVRVASAASEPEGSGVQPRSDAAAASAAEPSVGGTEPAPPQAAPQAVVISNHSGQVAVYDHERDPEPADRVEITRGTQAAAAPVLTDGPAPPRFKAPEPEPQQPVEKPQERRARNPWVADPSQLIEHAAAADALKKPTAGADSYATTEIESEERKYTGDPISITVKDADIKDVLRTFSTLTNLNIVLDPEVRGSVTVELRNVPWDQALDLILRINGLDYVLENNVLRVATTAKLAREKQELAKLLEEKEKAKPLRTVIKPLSYAKASTVASLLGGDSYLLSPRGSVVVDDRTNTLIIRDVVDRVEGVLKMIETLDQPTPQVVIEARIVETTRDFSHTLGLSWGFEGLMDSEHGNDTGLEFPNSVDVEGRVNLSRGGQNGLISLAFGDILNTFNLDMLLSAAENDGLVKIVSTPRVTTQNLTKAQIRSGLQIPVQTVSNNTVTVQYVDATLTLQVTPQITAEGTVLLEVDIRKQEPVLAAAVVGSTNSPIFTRDAQTQLLVRDGGTTVIAGIYQINDQKSEDRVPGLGKIPILGSLFRNRDVFKRHDELLIFITPRIVKY